MYILSNAVKNLIRNKGRNCLLGIILLVIIVATAISIMINTTSAAIINDYKARFGSEVSLDLDYEKAIKAGQFTQTEQSGKGVDEITPTQYFDFGDSKYLKEARFTASSMINFDKLKPVDDVDDKDLQRRGYIIGSNIREVSDDFKHGARKLAEGEMYQNENECIISEPFAKLNKLNVGDEIGIMKNADDKPVMLKVTGIYTDNTMLDGGDASEFMQKNPLLNRNNEILTDFDTIKTFGAESVMAKYFLKDPDMLGAFTKELRAEGLPEFYAVSTDKAGYNAVVGPVENMKKITTTFMIVVLILGGIILLLISTLAIRERKYEIGVLRAMGMKKAKVGTGFIAEMLILTFICLVIGLAISTFSTQPIADTLLSNQIKIAEESQNAGQTVTTMTTDPGQQNGTTLKPLSELTVHLGANEVAQISLIAFLLAFVASIMGVIYITRYEPMKILSERN
jgi:putative ABC transport system permease protein